MRTKRLQSLENFQTEKIKPIEVFGGWDGVLGTGPGEFAGYNYNSDIHFDEDGNGKLSTGEEMVFFWIHEAGKI